VPVGLGPPKTAPAVSGRGGDLDLLVVPEPGSLVLLIGGGLGLLLLLWRRNGGGWG